MEQFVTSNCAMASLCVSCVITACHASLAKSFRNLGVMALQEFEKIRERKERVAVAKVPVNTARVEKAFVEKTMIVGIGS